MVRKLMLGVVALCLLVGSMAQEAGQPADQQEGAAQQPGQPEEPVQPAEQEGAPQQPDQQDEPAQPAEQQEQNGQEGDQQQEPRQEQQDQEEPAEAEQPRRQEAAPAQQQGGGGQAEEQPVVAIDDYSPVTDERLLEPAPDDWLMYRRTYDAWGYSPLERITRENVSQLQPVWTLSSGVTHNHEAVPVINDGVMFVTAAFNRLWALDATSGDILWKYERDLPGDTFQEVCCDHVNRGVALYDDMVFMTTLDAHLLAFDAASGEIVWDKTVEDYKSGYTMTIAPLVVDGKVMVGVSGGEYGIRGFVQAFDAQTGDHLWKTYTTAGPGEPGNDSWPGDTWRYGGAPVWVTGSYDPELGLTYWGTGNGAPWMGSARPGDNLYVASVIAVDPQDGKIAHHFQYVPNDTWDYDEVAEHVLVDVERDGETIKGALHVARSGYLYLLDRTDLEFVYAEPVTTVTTFTGHEPDGRPIRDPDKVPDIGKEVTTCPSLVGPKNWNPTAYSPATGLLYSSIQHFCMTIGGAQISYQPGLTFQGAVTSYEFDPNAPDHTGELAAFDPATGQRVWSSEFPYMRASVLATGGGLVFAGGTPDRYFRAFDAETGDILWRFRTNSGVYGIPATYEVDGVQYVAVWAGWQPSGSRWGMVAESLGLNQEVPQGGALWVFALDTD
jgi:alcohol dehydrogenase (cytochrome c)